MKVKEETVIEIKNLKSLQMLWSVNDEMLTILTKGTDGTYFESLTLNKKQIFPVIRGLVSATQRFYRKPIKT